MRNPIQKALNAIREIRNVHENHFYPGDEEALITAQSRLEIMKEDGYK